MLSSLLWATTNDELLTIKSADDLKGFSLEDLNREDIQSSILDHNPSLITKFPPKITLHKSSLTKFAEKTYRFDFFIPSYLRSQESVRSTFQEFALTYKKNFSRFYDLTQNNLATRKPSLIHPDFFNDKFFVKAVMDTCLKSFMDIRPEDEGTQETRKKEFSRMFPYFKNKGIFTEAQINLYLEMHPDKSMLPHCYPLDHLLNKNFFDTVLRKYSHNLGEQLREQTPPTELLNILMEKYIKDEEESRFFPGSVGKLKTEELKTSVIQSWLLKVPFAIKYIQQAIPFNKELLEEFFKSTYRPERFFNDANKSDPTLAAFILQYKNDSPEMLHKERHKILDVMRGVGCCSEWSIKTVGNIFEWAPKELLNDASFHDDIYNQFPERFDMYLDVMGNKIVFPETLKNYLVETCTSGRVYKRFKDHPPHSLTKDTVTMEKIREACK